MKGFIIKRILIVYRVSSRENLVFPDRVQWIFDAEKADLRNPVSDICLQLATVIVNVVLGTC